MLPDPVGQASRPPRSHAPARRRWRRVGIWVSLVFHACLIAALAWWYVDYRRQERAREAAAANAVSIEQARLAEAPPQPSPEITPQQGAATLERALSHYGQKTPEENLAALEQHARRLESISSEQSVTEIAEKVRQWLNTQERSSQPAASPPEGEFDFDTAQIHQVHRADGGDGFAYQAVLVDAQGRTFQVEMSREEGERAWATMQSLKRFPLADRVYRQIAMPLIDRALREKRGGDGADRPPPMLNQTP